MSVDPTWKMKSKKSNFFGVLPKSDDEDPRLKRRVDRALTSSRKWTDAHMTAPSSRQLRRLRNRDINRQTKTFRRDQRRAQRAAVKHNERQAIIVLAAIEKGHGLEPGGLREQLIEDGALEGTRERVIDRETREVPSSHGVFRTEYTGAAITKSVPIGHTPVEILSAAGLTPEKIAEAHEALAAEVAA